MYASDDDEVFFESDADENGSVFASTATDECGHQTAKRRKYTQRTSESFQFLGRDVCFAALSRLVGVGSSTLQKIRQGLPTFTNCARPSLPKHPQYGFTMRGEGQATWESVLSFLWEIYHSTAEVLPNRYAMPGQDVEPPFPDADSTEIDRIVEGFSRTVQVSSNDANLLLTGPGTFSGPVRMLPYGTRTELFWQYVAACEAKGVAAGSYSTFMRVAGAVMRPNKSGGFLKFRKSSEHTQCDTCWKLRNRVAEATSMSERAAARKEHHRHILSQWRDRQCYWNHRSISHSAFNSALHNGRCHGKIERNVFLVFFSRSFPYGFSNLSCMAQ